VKTSWPVIEFNPSCSPILVTLMMQAIRSTETSVLTRVTQLDVPEDGLEKLKSYIALRGWVL
jgi:hypothetical protein